MSGIMLVVGWIVVPLGAEPLPVVNVRDWQDYVAIWAGALGALLAALAIIYAAWQATQAKKDLVRERRVEFELGLLAEIRHQMSITQLQHLSGYVAALIHDAADETELPVLRAVIGTKAGPEGRRERDAIANGVAGSQAAWLKRAEEEIDAAIERRLKE